MNRNCDSLGIWIETPLVLIHLAVADRPINQNGTKAIWADAAARCESSPLFLSMYLEGERLDLDSDTRKHKKAGSASFSSEYFFFPEADM